MFQSSLVTDTCDARPSAAQIEKKVNAIIAANQPRNMNSLEAWEEARARAEGAVGTAMDTSLDARGIEGASGPSPPYSAAYCAA